MRGKLSSETRSSPDLARSCTFNEARALCAGNYVPERRRRGVIGARSLQ